MEANSRDHELREALEQQRVTSEILRIIANSPTDPGPIFDSIVKNAARLCEANFAFVMLNEDGRLVLAARTDCTPEFAALLESGIPPNRATTTGRAALERRPIQVLDFLAEPGILVTEAHRAGGVRTVLAVPMCRDDRLLGVFSVWRREVRAFTERQIRLLETFADQAVIAIENVRLVRELEARNEEVTEALEQQTATAEILRAISRSPTDPLPIFEAIVRNAVALCGSLFANVFRYDGELLHYIASHNTGPGYVELLRSKYPMRPDESQVSGRVLISRSIIRLEDARSDPKYDQRFPTALGWGRMLGVPMMRDAQPLGVIVVGWSEAGPIPRVQEELLKTFADQAVIAIENVRLFEELQDKSRQLELANAFKSRFLAAASHDLRQPLHALNLFVAQLHAQSDPLERDRLVGRIDAAVGAMNELFNSLLDMSKLEAGMLETEPAEFPVERLLKRIETTFTGAAREKGLRLSVVPSGAWIRSDFVLLERILFNLVSNAVHYTARGGIVIGCRPRGARLKLEVWDSGPGIPEEHHQSVFREFYQLAGPGRDRGGGLGLGLAIVDGLGRLLDHPVELRSRPGRGSCFSVSVARVEAQHEPYEAPAEQARATDPLSGKLVAVIDDDALVLDGMHGILRSWGCGVVAEPSAAEALERLAEIGRAPDVIISDYRLADGTTGIEAIERLRGALGEAIPAFLISGDTAPERLRDAGAGGYHLLHKPVPPMALRAMLNGLLRSQDDLRAALREASRSSPAARAPALRPR